MAKKVKTKIKLQVAAGKATPAPPVGTALGPHGLNIMDFVNAFNERTREMGNTIIPVEVTVYEDRTFTFITKVPPAAELIRKALGIDKGSATPNKQKVGTLTKDQLKQIAVEKMPDLNTADVEQAKRVIAGTAESMGVDIEK
ncbi:TPA: 50S ribosomal protein L11 [candidate division CPR2 bacterium]|uniref:Large ribosomal subunit protein uL11 n=1 Tax=candidate division CPR2 bacterium GW2011_GWC1_41_48 TaxID=1618344 RepID=A0A0G0W7C5_UNCC2|nr:MAG: 50S ribosomal protein L11 [candidate division CPR2 bacterium GW2011_GWC2_39_35]KKR27925.1 MAG: 50S ribosomal protein L11 [candidate division CPR2 bacterium GW2011_GWD2_39_7]KKS08899.1 MAG: 50S ribosomal protein L11 [candidate division CPR2 bacterium GW2011_GWC1_41_48]OGB72043.1 MAG: 50S ribosomal protein L11 [candidate division CPR2 bacterium GWD2_39_7]HBG81716.1 50S ribosomal protein L11 [candidate division CPR2 bacterium]